MGDWVGDADCDWLADLVWLDVTEPVWDCEDVPELLEESVGVRVSVGVTDCDGEPVELAL